MSLIISLVVLFITKLIRTQNSYLIVELYCRTLLSTGPYCPTLLSYLIVGHDEGGGHGGDCPRQFRQSQTGAVDGNKRPVLGAHPKQQAFARRRAVVHDGLKFCYTQNDTLYLFIFFYYGDLQTVINYDSFERKIFLVL